MPSLRSSPDTRFTNTIRNRVNGHGQVPGHVLLWYTFNSCYKLHQRKSEATVEKAAEQIVERGLDTSADDGA